MSRMFRVLGMTLFCLNLYIGSTFAQTEDDHNARKTQVVIIGTLHHFHYDNPKYTPEVLKEIILSLKPDAILNELPLSQVDPNGRPLFRDPLKHPEGWAADTVAQQLGIKQIPFDRPDRQENFKKTNYFERQRKSSEQTQKWLESLQKKDPNSLDFRIAQIGINASYAQADLFDAAPEVINCDAFDLLIRIKHSVWKSILPEIIEKYPDYVGVVAEDRFFADQWNVRNRIMADNIIKAAKQYQGKRLVVITGAEHRYILRDLLKDEPSIELKEYWEITNINLKEVQKPDEPNQSTIQSQSLKDPIEYVLEKLDKYDLVMIGEHHYTKEQPTFVQNLIKRCYEKDTVDYLFLEFGDFEDQGKTDAFLQAREYNPQLVIEVLKNSTTMGWGYQEYFDIFKTIYFENKDRPEKEKIRIVLVDGPPSTLNMNPLYDCLNKSSLSEAEKWQKVCWLREGIAGRDPFMAEVIATHLFDESGKKGIYYAGSAHIRKDLREKDYGLRLFSAGGILVRKYPKRVCSLTFHKESRDWQNLSNFQSLEQLHKRYAKAFAVDTTNPRINHFKLKSDVSRKGVPLTEAFDGYIVLNLYKDYHDCSLVPDFYDDDFAKEIWERLRKDKERFAKFPPELEKFKNRPWSGKELRELMKQGQR